MYASLGPLVGCMRTRGPPDCHSRGHRLCQGEFLPWWCDGRAPLEMDVMYGYVGVSRNRGTPKSSIFIGFSIINHPFWGTTIFGNTHVWLIIRGGKFPFSRFPEIPGDTSRSSTIHREILQTFVVSSILGRVCSCQPSYHDWLHLHVYAAASPKTC